MYSERFVSGNIKSLWKISYYRQSINNVFYYQLKIMMPPVKLFILSTVNGKWRKKLASCCWCGNVMGGNNFLWKGKVYFVQCNGSPNECFF